MQLRKTQATASAYNVYLALAISCAELVPLRWNQSYKTAIAPRYNRLMGIIYYTRQKLLRDGFAILENVFPVEDIGSITKVITQVPTDKTTYKNRNDLFAMRQFLREVPAAYHLIFTPPLNLIISQLFGKDYFVTKSIYFDKPEQSNWFVAYHQDLTISVDKKADIDGFSSWTVKQNQFAVQPPLTILESNFSVRIHLDDTNEHNGALKVIPGSHLKGVYRPETIDWKTEIETFCCVRSGGIMIMKPLLLHASNRTTNNHKRRVIHIEFSNHSLPDILKWSEKMLLCNK